MISVELPVLCEILLGVEVGVASVVVSDPPPVAVWDDGLVVGGLVVQGGPDGKVKVKIYEPIPEEVLLL